MPSIRNKNIKLIELDALLKTARNERQVVFGADKKAKIEFKKDNTDFLIISGSSAGLVLSGSSIVFDGNANFSSGIKLKDNEKLYFGTDDDSFLVYSSSIGSLVCSTVDAANGPTIRMPTYSAQGLVIQEGDKVVSALNDWYISINTADEVINFFRDTWVSDDIKLKFGSGGEAHIEYDEDGQNYLIISGSSEGTILSGSNIHITGSSMVLSGTSTVDITGNSSLSLSGSSVFISGSVNINRKTGTSGGHGFIYSSNGNCLKAGVLGKHQGFVLTHTGAAMPYGPNDSIIDLRASNDGDADEGDAAGHISVNTGSGEIVKWYDAISALNTAGPGTPCVLDHQNWRKADANVSSGTNNSQKLMGIYLGDDLVLLRGWFKIATSRMDNQPSALSSDPGGGSPVYLGGSNTGSSCVYDMLPPSGSGDIVRIIGHLVDKDSDGYLIYFNPSNDWVKVS